MASTYLSRTQSSSNQQIFTISSWCKFGQTVSGVNNYLTNFFTDANNRIGNIFLDTNDFLFYGLTSGSASVTLQPSQKFRDVNGWYHFVIKVDTTQATASDRVKIYINGTQITAFASETYPAQNTNFPLNTNHYIGTYDTSAHFWSGSLAHYHYCDGYAYDASYFGETDANGVWKPKTSPSVTYGTNGFFLKFENSGSMGTDSSGNGNNFTVNGTLTQTVDTPSNVYATLNPLDVPEVAEKPTMSYGNLQGASTALGHVSGISTLGADTGKWYSEFKLTATDDATNCLCGVVKDAGFNLGTNALHDSTYFYGARGNGYKFTASSGTASWGSTWTTNDIIGLGLDCDNGRLYVSKNGQWSDGSGNYNQSTPSAYVTLPTSSLYFLCCGDAGNTTTATFQANFGNGFFGTTSVSSAGSNGNGSIFEYDVPSGYYALNTKNLATYG